MSSPDSNSIGRRQLLTGAAAAGLAMTLPAGRAKASPNERVNICVIGVRGRGSGVGRNFAGLPDAQVTHICDVNTTLLEAYGKSISDVQKSAPKAVQDLRRALDDKSVDAIVVTTPDHWHALATIWGCQAGKHVYVEKPISNNIFEGRQMVAAARKYNRVVQVGTQSRSAEHYLEIMKQLQAGRIGRVHMAKAWNSQLRRKVPPCPMNLCRQVWTGTFGKGPHPSGRITRIAIPMAGVGCGIMARVIWATMACMI